MNIDRANKIKSQAVSNVFGIFSSARIYKSTSTEINDRFLNLKKSLPKGTPQWVSTFLDGMREVLVANLYADALEFCYVVKGKIYSVNKESDRYYEKHGITPEQLNNLQESSGHYWIDTEKAFFSG
jgi:hypothetical protein